jgi:hypothetical protein
MDICAYDGCEHTATVDCFQDVIVETGSNLVPLGPIRLCEEHTRTLERWFVEMRYPDERIVRNDDSRVRWTLESDAPG